MLENTYVQSSNCAMFSRTASRVRVAVVVVVVLDYFVIFNILKFISNFFVDLSCERFLMQNQ